MKISFSTRVLKNIDTDLPLRYPQIFLKYPSILQEGLV